MSFLKFLHVENYESNLKSESEKIRYSKSRDADSFKIRSRDNSKQRKKEVDNSVSAEDAFEAQTIKPEGSIIANPNNISQLNLLEGFSLRDYK